MSYLSHGHYTCIYSCGCIESQCPCPNALKTNITLSYPCKDCAPPTERNYSNEDRPDKI